MNRCVHWLRLIFLVVALGFVCAAQAVEPIENSSASASPLGLNHSPTNALTLESAVMQALAHNPELRTSRSRVNAAVGHASQAGLWSNPELTFAAEDIPVSNGSFQDSKDTIGLAQTVPYPGKKKLEHQVGVAGVRLTESQWASRRLELEREVKTAFFRVLGAEALVEVSRKLVAVAESSAATARKRVTAGAAADQEQLRAEIQLEQARTELAGFERDFAVTRQELATLLGLPDLGERTLSGTLLERPDSRLLELGPDHWLSQHPGTQAARSLVEQHELEFKRARLEPYPDVTFGVSGGREGPSDVSIVEFRVGVPLPIIDRAKGRKLEAKANVEGARAQLAATEQRLIRDWNIGTRRFRTAAEQVATYRDRILPKAGSALVLVQTGFQEGKFGLIDLLDTQRTTTEVQLTYQQKLLELNIAQADLEALVGRLTISAQTLPSIFRDKP